MTYIEVLLLTLSIVLLMHYKPEFPPLIFI